MNDLMIAYIFEPVESGKRFTQWPLHLTLLPWFKAPDRDDAIDRLKTVSGEFKAIELFPSDRDYFGPDRDLPVTLIKPNAELTRLHKRLLSLTDEQDWQLQGRYTGSAYRPHVTQKAGRDVESSFVLDCLHVVEAQPMGYRQVVGMVELDA